VPERGHDEVDGVDERTVEIEEKRRESGAWSQSMRIIIDDRIPKYRVLGSTATETPCTCHFTLRPYPLESYPAETDHS